MFVNVRKCSAMVGNGPGGVNGNLVDNSADVGVCSILV